MSDSRYTHLITNYHTSRDRQLAVGVTYLCVVGRYALHSCSLLFVYNLPCTRWFRCGSTPKHELVSCILITCDILYFSVLMSDSDTGTTKLVNGTVLYCTFLLRFLLSPLLLGAVCTRNVDLLLLVLLLLLYVCLCHMLAFMLVACCCSHRVHTCFLVPQRVRQRARRKVT